MVDTLGKGIEAAIMHIVGGDVNITECWNFELQRIRRFFRNADFAKIIQKIIYGQADIPKAVIGKKRFGMAGNAIGLE
ncbi:MAG: hypothetical protein EOO02_23410 [Chitinophagaceae bacterium]|nr:MAG: hypothetical protein EOO02_23410 [Chitinophagaceae bacterium]